MARVNYTEWLPDQPTFQNPGLVIADGVYSVANGYAPIRSFQAAQNGQLPGTALGAGAYRRDSLVYVFAADETDIYRYSASGFDSLVTGLASSSLIGVSFAPYGNLMLATNGVDPIQKFDPAAPTVMTDLGGTPPTVRYIATVGGFVVGAYANDDELTIAWSGLADPEEWTPGVNDAGEQTFASGGALTGIVGGDYGVVFQENKITRMTQTFDATVWQFDDIAIDIGCAIPRTLAAWNKISFFYSERGFMMCDGTSVIPIGEEKVDRTFASIINRSYIETISAVVDPRNSNYIVLVPSAAPANSVYIYNYSLKRWTTGPITAELLFSSLAEPITLEDLDALYGNLDLIPISLDSAAFKGGTSLAMLFDGTHTLGTLSGPPVTATLSNGLIDMAKDRQTRLRWIRPITDASQVQISVKGAQSLADDLTETIYSNRGPGGVYRMRENWDYMAIGLQIAGGQSWSFVQGFDSDAVQGGKA